MPMHLSSTLRRVCVHLSAGNAEAANQGRDNSGPSWATRDQFFTRLLLIWVKIGSARAETIIAASREASHKNVTGEQHRQEKRPYLVQKLAPVDSWAIKTGRTPITL